MWYAIVMDSDSCLIYKGDFYIVEWYFDDDGYSQAYEYFLKTSSLQKRKFLILVKKMADFGIIYDTSKFRNEGDSMKSTFDEFITSNPRQKALFDKEYDEFLLSEFIIQKMEEENISVRSLAQKASVSPTVIQKLRNNDNAEKITYSTFVSVIRSLGYKMRLEKI